MSHRYDLFGERIEDDEPTPAMPHPETCERGWLGQDLDGSLVPCLVCKPHLRDYFARRWAR